MKTVYVPEDCCFDSADDCLHVFPRDAVSLLVSEYEFDKVNAKLIKAVKFLKQGKIKFTPNTTNSDVDMFLKDF